VVSPGLIVPGGAEKLSGCLWDGPGEADDDACGDGGRPGARRKFGIAADDEVRSGALMGPLEASCGCWNDAKGVCDETARAGALILGIVDGLRGSDRMGEKEGLLGLDKSMPRFEPNEAGLDFEKNDGTTFDWVSCPAKSFSGSFWCPLTGAGNLGCLHRRNGAWRWPCILTEPVSRFGSQRE